MGRLLFVALFAISAFAADPAATKQQIDSIYPDLDKLYVDLHQNPELAFQEKQTSAKLAERLKAMGYDVTTGVGQTGIVAILKNGDGPTVLLRTDMDALPIEEKTGLPFASHVKEKNSNGDTVPVMHACGHDVHMTSWIGTAKLMAENRQQWHGTLMLIGQPAEEVVSGASAMIKDGLFTKFPHPDYAFAVHDDDSMPAGVVGFHPGPFRASADSVDITIFGKGGHGAKPQATIDPVLIASRTVVALHNIISREIDPQDPAVITVGSINGGNTYNVIPDQVKLQLTVRSYSPVVRKHLLASIERVAKGESLAGGAPKEPIVTVKPGTDTVVNDPETIARIVNALKKSLGDAAVHPMPAYMTSEDFSQYSQNGTKAVLLHVGAQEPTKFASAKQNGMQLPTVHTSLWQPDAEPTIKTAIMVETTALMELMSK
jgi:hippurate hydrolase